MSKNYNCLNCHSSNHHVIAKESYDEAFYEISQCENCQLIFTSKQSHDANSGYVAITRDAFFKKYGAITSGKKPHDRHLNYLQEVNIIKTFAESGEYLDVGCNAGWLLSYLKKYSKFSLTGIEPSPIYSQLAAELSGAKIINSYVTQNSLPNNHFDFISMTDVFEHLPNPNEVLSLLNSSMKQGGHLMIKVPNGAFTIFKSKCVKLFPWLVDQDDVFNAKEHLGHYTMDILTSILKKNGFEVVREYTPLPIQTYGSRKITILSRKLVYHLGKLKLIPAQDLLVIAKKII